MIEEEKYCIDILTQVSAMTKALQSKAFPATTGWMVVPTMTAMVAPEGCNGQRGNWWTWWCGWLPVRRFRRGLGQR